MFCGTVVQPQANSTFASAVQSAQRHEKICQAKAHGKFKQRQAKASSPSRRLQLGSTPDGRAMLQKKVNNFADMVQWAEDQPEPDSALHTRNERQHQVINPTRVSWTRKQRPTAPKATQAASPDIELHDMQPAGPLQQGGNNSFPSRRFPRTPHSITQPAGIARQPKLSAQHAYLQRLQDAAAAWQHASQLAAEQPPSDSPAGLASDAGSSSLPSQLQGSPLLRTELHPLQSATPAHSVPFHMAHGREQAHLHGLVAAADRWKQANMQPGAYTRIMDSQVYEATSSENTFDGQSLRAKPKPRSDHDQHGDLVDAQEAWLANDVATDADSHASSQDRDNCWTLGSRSWKQGDIHGPPPPPPPPPLTFARTGVEQEGAGRQKASWLAALRGEAPTWAL